MGRREGRPLFGLSLHIMVLAGALTTATHTGTVWAQTRMPQTIPNMPQSGSPSQDPNVPGEAGASQEAGPPKEPAPPTEQEIDYLLPIEGNETVITGTWTPHAQRDSPVEIERVTGKMLEQAGATNIGQSLQDVPAVQPGRGGGGFPQFQIQGLPSINTLFLLNSQELIGTIEGATFTRDILASPEIDSIEIIKGAAAVQYGSDAIAGVINIRTKYATKEAGAKMFGQYGRFNTATVFGAPEFKAGKFSGFFSAGMQSTTGFDLNQATPQTDGPAQANTKSLSGNLAYEFSIRSKLSLYSRYSDDERKTKQNPSPAGTSIREVKADVQRSQNILRWDYQPDAVSNLIVWGHYQNFLSDSSTFRLGDNTRTRYSSFTQELFEPQFQYSRQVGKEHLITGGGEYDIRRGRGVNLAGGATQLNESALWGQDEITLLKDVEVMVGGRYTSNSKYGGFFSPQTTILVKPGDFRGRFTYTRGFRSPDLVETGGAFVEGGGVGIVGRQNLQAEKSVSYTTNFEYYWEKAKIGASLFRHQVSNQIQFLAGGCSAAEATSLGVTRPLCFKGTNVGAVQSQGVELEAGGKPTNWLYVETGYMYLDAYDQNTGSQLFQRSPHSFKSRVVVEHDGWSLTTRLRWYSSFGFGDLNTNQKIDPNEKAPSNLQLDMRLAKTLKNGIEVYGGGENMTSSRMNFSSGLIPQPGVMLWFVGMRMTM